MTVTEKSKLGQWWRALLKTFQAERLVGCPECDGRGEIEGEPIYEDDPLCSMSGCGGGVVSYPIYKCPTCGGSGNLGPVKEKP